MQIETTKSYKFILYVHFIIVGLSLITTTEAQDVNGQLILRSDVAALGHYKEIETYQAYNPTVIAWGWPLAYPRGLTARQRRDLIQSKIDIAYQQGIRLLTTNIDMVTATAWVLSEKPELQKAVVRDIHNNPMLVYWFEHVTYEGVPTYWGCTNNPSYRAHIKDKVKLGVSLGANALHLDDPRGSAWLENGGCFCDFCINKFRQDLKENYSAQKLIEMGIEDIVSFNYRDRLGSIFETREAFTTAYKKRQTIPLITEYESFLYHRASAFLEELAITAKEQSKNPNFPVSANTYDMQPHYMIGVDNIDLFVTEVNHQKQGGMVPVFAYKLVDALGKPLILTANASDWGLIKTSRNTSLVLSWIAQSYAFGHQFMTPYRQWVFVNHRQTTAYDGPTDVYAPIYRFIGEHRELFDGYEAASQVALIYNHNALKKGNETIYEVCGQLAQANIQFDMIIAGDDWLSPRLETSLADPYQHIIIPDSTTLGYGQQAIVDRWVSESRAGYFRHIENITENIYTWIQTSSSTQLFAVARVKKDMGAVVHLINPVRKENKEFQKQLDIELKISQDLIGGREPMRVTFHSLFGGSMSLDFSVKDESILIKVPELRLWGIVKLEGFKKK